MSKPSGQRLKSIKVRCQQCSVPNYEPLQNEKVYRVIVESYARHGGNRYPLIKTYLKNVKKGPVNFGVYRNFIKQRSPLFEELNDRIIFIRD